MTEEAFLTYIIGKIAGNIDSLDVESDGLISDSSKVMGAIQKLIESKIPAIKLVISDLYKTRER